MAVGRRPEDEQSQEVHHQRHGTIHVFIDNKEITQKRSELFRRDAIPGQLSLSIFKLILFYEYMIDLKNKNYTKHLDNYELRLLFYYYVL